ncbi:MAG: hypothetical protein IT360_12860 [Gemmatimonadaceae bacterium]|nr:hypothetical protein [Gemmatimonadaceae bacterium]
MHIELVDSLRCPHPHEDTWLVASVTRFDGRDIVQGMLGCPVCRRQYVVQEGEVDFTAARDPRPAVRRDADEREAAPPGPIDHDELLRARAVLALGEAGGIVMLGGTHAQLAAALADEAQVAPLLLNPPDWARDGGRFPSALRVDDVLPLAGGVLRAAWLDAATATSPLLAATVRALRPGGRLVAPARCALPAGATELARDGHEWVAESTAVSSAPVSLRRR